MMIIIQVHDELGTCEASPVPPKQSVVSSTSSDKISIIGLPAHGQVLPGVFAVVSRAHMQQH